MEVSIPDDRSSSRIDWFEPLVRQLEVPAYQLALMLTHQQDTAEEVVQEAFVRAWIAKRTPRDLSDFRPWLYRIIVNLIHDHSRRDRVRQYPPIEIGSHDPVAESERRLNKSTLAEALHSLSDREREVIYLRFFEDLPYREVGRIVGGNEVNIRVRLHRALKKIRKALEGAPDVGLKSKAI